MKLAVFLLASFVLLAPCSCATEVVVPNVNKDVEGDYKNKFPFFDRPMRYQQLYESGELVKGIIKAISFRLQGEDESRGDGIGLPFSSTFENLSVCLSTSDKEIDELMDSFADNIGADEACFSYESLTLESVDDSGSPRDFEIKLPLGSGFYYDPSDGNLLLDVRVKNEGSFKEDNYLDKVEGSAAVSRIYTLLSGPDAEEADQNWPGEGLVTQFTYQVDPKTSPPSMDSSSKKNSKGSKRSKATMKKSKSSKKSSKQGMMSMKSKMKGSMI